MANRAWSWASEWLSTFRGPGIQVHNNLAPGVELPPWASAEWLSSVSRAMDSVAGMSPAKVWESQPNVRSVVDFLARNVAQLGLHCFREAADGGRERDKVSPLARLLDDPSAAQTPFELVRSIVSDLSLYSSAWLAVLPTTERPSGWAVRPLPVASILDTKGSEWGGDLSALVSLDGESRPLWLPWDNLVHIHGWAPAYGNDGVTPLRALQDVIAEQVAAQAYRSAMWKNGGQVGSYVARPHTAPAWSAEAEDKFVKSLRAFRAGGALAGGQPLLQDGMEIKTVRLNAKEEQWVEAAQLSLEAVCRVFQVNPSMLGSTGGVTYANLKEFRRALYTETLAPILVQVEQKLTRELQRVLHGGRDESQYLEFNLKAKLAGSFEEEGDVLFKATGGPHMTLNEARARQNLTGIGPAGDVVLRPLNMAPPVGPEGPEGGTAAASSMSADELLKRVNVAKGLIQYGFAPMAALMAAGLDPIQHLGLLPTTLQSPEKVDADADAALAAADEAGAADGDEPKSAPAGPVSVKAVEVAREGNRSVDLLRGALEKFAARQRAAVLSRLGTKSATWWDGKRWDRELSEELTRAAVAVSAQLGAATAERLGYKGGYDPAETVNFLVAVARSRAEMINATTYDQLQAALEKADPPAGVFDELDGARGDQSVTTLHTTLAAFAGVEAARQVGRRSGRKAMKTWVVRSGHPRAAHSRMDGQTVPVGEKFSNGAMWPGDAVLGADGVAGCQCSVEIELLDGDNE